MVNSEVFLCISWNKRKPLSTKGWNTSTPSPHDFQITHNGESNPKGLASLSNTHLSPKGIGKKAPQHPTTGREQTILPAIFKHWNTGDPTAGLPVWPPLAHQAHAPWRTSPPRLPSPDQSRPRFPACISAVTAGSLPPTALTSVSFPLQIPCYRVLYFVKHQLFLIHVLRPGTPWGRVRNTCLRLQEPAV